MDKLSFRDYISIEYIEMNIVNNFSEVKQTPVNSQVKSVSPTGVKPDLEYKPDILDIASEKIINKRDITDTVTMPRTIKIVFSNRKIIF